MKVLGYVNCYNRGIADVQRELTANGNPLAGFDLSLMTALRVAVQSAASAVSQENEGKNHRASDLKSSMKSEDRLLMVLKDNQTMFLPNMAEAIGLSIASVRKVLDKLRVSGRIRRVGPDKGGHWEVLGGKE